MPTETFDVIKTARSVRRYQDKPLPDEAAREILEAGRRSGSSKNEQPWHFVAVRDRTRLKALAEAGNYARQVAEAGMAVALATKGSPDPFMFDLGRASQNMVIAARALGIGSCVVYFHHPDKACEALNLPQGYHCEWGIAFGYPAEALDRPPKPGGRRPAEEVIHWDKW